MESINRLCELLREFNKRHPEFEDLAYVDLHKDFSSGLMTADRDIIELFDSVEDLLMYLAEG